MKPEMFSPCLQVLGAPVGLPLRPSASLASPLHLLLLPRLREDFLLERTGTAGATGTGCF